DPHGCRSGVRGGHGPRPEGCERIDDGHVNPTARLAVSIGVVHEDVEVARFRIDPDHRLLDPVGDAGGVGGIYRAVAGAFPDGVVDAAPDEVDEAEFHDA